MSSMNFTCDVCGREVFSCTFVNGMKFCAKCYQETFGEIDKDRKIADLEAKLAESESKRKSLEEKVKFLTEEIKECFVDGQKYNELREQKDKEIQELKQQLAEKEKNALALFSALYDILEEQDPENVSSRIDYLTKQNNGAIGDFYKEHKVLKQELEEKEKEISEVLAKQSITCLNTIEKAYQDKISFAIAELEKVKEFCEKELKECDKLLKTEFEDDFYIQSVMARESMCFDFRRTIDSQIKQLKEKECI